MGADGRGGGGLVVLTPVELTPQNRVFGSMAVVVCPKRIRAITEIPAAVEDWDILAAKLRKSLRSSINESFSVKNIKLGYREPTYTLEVDWDIESIELTKWTQPGDIVMGDSYSFRKAAAEGGAIVVASKEPPSSLLLSLADGRASDSQFFDFSFCVVGTQCAYAFLNLMEVRDALIDDISRSGAERMIKEFRVVARSTPPGSGNCQSVSVRERKHWSPGCPKLHIRGYERRDMSYIIGLSDDELTYTAEATLIQPHGEESVPKTTADNTNTCVAEKKKTRISGRVLLSILSLLWSIAVIVIRMYK
eukprot:GHVO01042630.1.p1 GENE.GHVO01042630.1~~GHVO01042630.1.p1  ORF type:complete len:306 (-),score=81.20 GHVO01042630.1:20-937(-)